MWSILGVQSANSNGRKGEGQKERLKGPWASGGLHLGSASGVCSSVLRGLGIFERASSPHGKPAADDSRQPGT